MATVIGLRANATAMLVPSSSRVVCSAASSSGRNGSWLISAGPAAVVAVSFERGRRVRDARAGWGCRRRPSRPARASPMHADATVSNSVWSTSSMPVRRSPATTGIAHDEEPGLGGHARRPRPSASAHAGRWAAPERLAKHHDKGKLDARARIEHLLDQGTFREFGTLVGGEIAADGIVAGSGLINGSPVMVGAEDFTTLAGSIGPGGNSKRYRHRRAGAARQDPAGDAARGRRLPAQRRALRPHPHRPARPGAVLGPGPDRRRACSARRPGTARWSRRCATSGS